MIARHLIVPLTLAVVALGAVDAFGQTPFPAPLPNGAVGTAQDPAFPPVRGAVGTPNDPAFPPVNGAKAKSTAGTRNDPAFPPVNGAATPRISTSSAFPSGGAAPVLGAGGGGFGAPPPQQAAPPGGEDCMKEFIPLREAAEKHGKMIQAASARHAPPDEACKLIGQYAQAEIKMTKFVDTHAKKCGIPDAIGKQLHHNEKATGAMLTKVCNVAKQARLQGSAGPSLSDVLGSASGPEATTTKKGGSTFDTLSGNVLTR